MHWRKMFPALMAAVALTLATSGIVFAEETVPVAEQIAALDVKYSAATQYIWVLVAAALVMFMQAGFAMVEAGFCRAKNATKSAGSASTPARPSAGPTTAWRRSR